MKLPKLLLIYSSRIKQDFKENNEIIGNADKMVVKIHGTSISSPKPC